MYFSNFYSFPNLIFKPNDILTSDISSTPSINEDTTDYLIVDNFLGKKVIDPSENRLTSYFLEFWFKLDYLNDPVNLTQNEYFFYGYPHSIIRSYQDKAFKYTNQEISDGAYYYPLTTIHNYEWNRIIIENKFIGEFNRFSIKVYINYDFSSPQVEILVDATQGKMHFKGIVFCNGIYTNNVKLGIKL